MIIVIDDDGDEIEQPSSIIGKANPVNFLDFFSYLNKLNSIDIFIRGKKVGEV